MGMDVESSNTFNTNLDLFNEVYKNEVDKLKTDIENAENEDLFGLRQISRSTINDHLSGKRSRPLRSARGMSQTLTVQDQWKRHFDIDETTGECLNSRGTKMETADYDVNFMN